MTKQRLALWAKVLSSAAIFGAIAWFLYRELKAIDLEAVGNALASISPARLAMSGGFTVLSYLSLTQYDRLAVRYLQKPLGYPRILWISAVSYAFNFNLGALVGGVALRFRYYYRTGLPLGDITKLTIFCGVTSWLGYAAIAGLVFGLVPLPMPEAFRMGQTALQIAGGGLVVLAAVYLGACALRQKPVRIKKVTLTCPTPGMAAKQLAVAMAQWLFVSTAAYVLFPPGADYGVIVGTYFLAAVAGLIAHIPAGVGVIESVFIVFLDGRFPKETILGSLIAFRAIYYLLPLTLAIPGVVALELRTLVGMRATRRPRRGPGAIPSEGG